MDEKEAIGLNILNNFPSEEISGMDAFNIEVQPTGFENACTSEDIVPKWYSDLNFTDLIGTETWQVPKPWSPKPLTPTRDMHFKFPNLEEDSTWRPYGSPQKILTPPKLPSCARRQFTLPFPATHSTPAPPRQVKPMAPLGTKDGTSPGSGGSPSPRKSTSDTSGYSSNSSGFFGFSSPSLSLELSDEAISMMATESPSSPAEWDIYESLLETQPSPMDKNILAGEESEEDKTPRAQSTNFSDISDNNIIYQGTSYLGTPSNAETLSNLSQSPDVLLYSPPDKADLPQIPTPIFTYPLSNNPNSTESFQPHDESTTDTIDAEDTEHLDKNILSHIEAIQTETDNPAASGNEKEKKSPKTENVKPKEPYIALIAKILLGSEEKKMILQDIYDTLQEKYSYFKTAENSWRNVVRHNLSINDSFVKAGRASSGRGFYWAIHPACVDMFKSGDFRRREAKKLVQQSKENTMVTPNARNIMGNARTSAPIPVANQQKHFHGNSSQGFPLSPLSVYTYNIPTSTAIAQAGRSFDQSQAHFGNAFGLCSQNQQNYPIGPYGMSVQGNAMNYDQSYSRSAPC